MARNWWMCCGIVLCGVLMHAQAHAADACPALRSQLASPVVAIRIAAAACAEHQNWYQPYIDRDGHYAGSRVREAENADLRNDEPAWRRVVDYWRDSGLLPQAYGRPGASDCEYAAASPTPSPTCRGFVVDVPWSAAFVSYVMRRAQVPGFVASPSHVTYVRDAYRNQATSAYQVANPLASKPAQGDMLCYVRVSSRVYGFGGLATLLSSSGDGLNMHCDIVVAANPDNDHTLYAIGGNVLDAVTMRLLKLTPGGQLADLPLRSLEDGDCSPDTPMSCNASRQDWAVLLQLKTPQQLAQLAPAPPFAPASGAASTLPAQAQCCVNCVVGSGIPRCPVTPSPVVPPTAPAAGSTPAP